MKHMLPHHYGDPAPANAPATGGQASWQSAGATAVGKGMQAWFASGTTEKQLEYQQQQQEMELKRLEQQGASQLAILQAQANLEAAKAAQVPPPKPFPWGLTILGLGLLGGLGFLFYRKG